MVRVRSFLLAIAARFTTLRPASEWLDRRMWRNFAIGTGLVAVIVLGYAYAPEYLQYSASPGGKETVAGATAPASGAALAQNLAATPEPSAQTPSSSIEDRIPVPEAANVPPPSRADIEREGSPKPVDSIEAKVPVPEPAAVQPPSKADLAPANETTTAAPASEPVAPPQIFTGKDLVKAPLAASLASADVAIAEKLRDLLANRLDRFFSRKNERSAVEAFYRDRGFAPLWIENGAQSARADAAIKHLKSVNADGLDPADYPTPDLKAITEPDALADAELKLTNSVLTYARHAQTGRVHFSRISADIFYLPTAPEPAEVLANIAGAKNVGEALDSYNPPQPGYKALKAKLAEARAKKGDAGPVRIEKGPLLKYAKDKKGQEILMQDARVPQLRERLAIAAQDNTTYDKPLADAVAKFQRQHGLPVSAQLNQATIDALNGPRRDRDADVIIANLERWRWMPRDLGKIYVMVNIPDFTLKVVRDGAMVWTTRIVTGKPNLATPITSAYMQYITVNPTWNVPPSIIANEYIPALQQDPQAMTRIGLKVTENPDGTIHIYQPPGDANALGRIRFNFPNKFLVYQHDTPDKQLFAHEKRAYSHGCMRVQDPLKYAEVLLGIVMPKEGYTQERLRKMFGSAEVDIRFQPSAYIPVHLTYQTAFVDDAGKLVIREDVYGRDARILAALKGDERRVADVAIERSPTGSGVSREALRLPGGYYGGDRYGNGRNSFEDFFRRIFR